MHDSHVRGHIGIIVYAQMFVFYMFVEVYVIMKRTYRTISVRYRQFPGGGGDNFTCHKSPFYQTYSFFTNTANACKYNFDGIVQNFMASFPSAASFVLFYCTVKM